MSFLDEYELQNREYDARKRNARRRVTKTKRINRQKHTRIGDRLEKKKRKEKKRGKYLQINRGEVL